MPMMWLLRMMQWVRNPPSKQMRTIIAIVFCIGASFALFEYFFGWPEALTVNPRMRGIGVVPQPQPVAEPGS